MGIIHLIIFLAIGGKIAARPRRSPEGERILIEEAPYFVSIRSASEQVCGGVLLNDEIVLTMAGCLTYGMTTVASGVDENNPNGTVHRILSSHQDNILPVDTLILLNLMEFPDIGESVNMPLGELSYSETAHFISFQPENAQLRRFQVTMAPWHVCSMDDHLLCASQKSNRAMQANEVGGPLVLNGRLVGIAAHKESLADGYDVYVDFHKLWRTHERPNNPTRMRGSV